MNFIAKIDILPHTELLDPQGKTVTKELSKMGLSINDARIGKHIELKIEAKDENEAASIVKSACENLLVNKIMEKFVFSLEKQ